MIAKKAEFILTKAVPTPTFDNDDTRYLVTTVNLRNTTICPRFQILWLLSPQMGSSTANRDVRKFKCISVA